MHALVQSCCFMPIAIGLLYRRIELRHRHTGMHVFVAYLLTPTSAGSLSVILSVLCVCLSAR